MRKRSLNQNHLPIVIAFLTSLGGLSATSRAAAELDEDNRCRCRQTRNVCTYNVGYVQGARRGDLVFQTGTGKGVGTKLMQALGLERTHVGMMLDTKRVRHNTASMKAVADSKHTLGNSFEEAGDCAFGTFEVGDIGIRAETLLKGGPGLHSAAFVDESEPDPNSDGSYSKYWSGTLERAVVKAGATATNLADAAADKLEARSSAYNVYAFSDWLKARDTVYWDCKVGFIRTTIVQEPGQAPPPAIADCTPHTKGSMCSGSVYQAWTEADPKSSIQDGAYYGGFRLKDYSAQYRKEKAFAAYSVLYNAIYNAVHQDGGPIVWSGFLDWDICDFSYTDETNIATSIARQIVNAFGYNHLEDFSNHNDPAIQGVWDDIGTGRSVSPDDLIEKIEANQTSYEPVLQPVEKVPSSYTCQEQVTWVNCACDSLGAE